MMSGHEPYQVGVSIYALTGARTKAFPPQGCRQRSPHVRHCLCCKPLSAMGALDDFHGFNMIPLASRVTLTVINCPQYHKYLPDDRELYLTPFCPPPGVVDQRHVSASILKSFLDEHSSRINSRQRPSRTEHSIKPSNTSKTAISSPASSLPTYTKTSPYNITSLPASSLISP